MADDDQVASHTLVHSYVAALNAHDPDAVASLVTDDFANHHASALGRPTDGREAYRAALPGFFRDVPGLHYDVEQLAVEGDTVAAAYRLTADGDIDVRGVWWLTVRAGRLAARTDYWDALTVLRQRGDL